MLEMCVCHMLAQYRNDRKNELILKPGDCFDLGKDHACHDVFNLTRKNETTGPLLPSGKPTKKYGKSQSFNGKLNYCYVSLPEGNGLWHPWLLPSDKSWDLLPRCPKSQWERNSCQEGTLQKNAWKMPPTISNFCHMAQKNLRYIMAIQLTSINTKL